MTAPRRRYVPPRDPDAEQICSLDRETAMRRSEPPDRLLEEARSQDVRKDGAEYRFQAKPGIWERVATFVDEEGDCCPFFAFEQREDGGDVVLRILRPQARKEG